jgi:transposase
LRYLRQFGTQSFDLVDHVGLAGRRRENVEARGIRREHRRAIGASIWIHGLLQSEGVESHVVDAASIATSRRRRRAKTDKIDGEALVRALLAYKRGESRVCAMVWAPTPEDEDRRRLCRERKTLTNERVQHVNRIKGLLFSQGISDYEPLRRNRRQRLDELKTGDARPLPPHLKAQITRELDWLELLLEQIEAVEIERDALISAMKPEGMNADAVRWPLAMLTKLNRIGPEIAAILWSRGSIEASPIEGKSRPTQGWLRHRGKADRLRANKGCPKRATRGCVQQCYTNPTSRIGLFRAGKRL